jgi:hypothetical protein
MNSQLLTTARHEMRHAWFAETHSMQIERITLEPGCTSYASQLPMTAQGLYDAYRVFPALTTRRLVEQIAVIIVGHAGLGGSFTGSDDALILRAWRLSWQAADTGGPRWPDLVAQADREVQRWLHTYPHTDVIDGLSLVLVNERVIDRQRWAELAQSYAYLNETLLRQRTAVTYAPPVISSPDGAAAEDLSLSVWDFAPARQRRRPSGGTMYPHALQDWRRGGLFALMTSYVA